jgi:hypothetical protein
VEIKPTTDGAVNLNPVNIPRLTIGN